jgi:conjugal transfer pilus assembly protein TraB
MPTPGQMTAGGQMQGGDRPYADMPRGMPAVQQGQQKAMTNLIAIDEGKGGDTTQKAQGKTLPQGAKEQAKPGQQKKEPSQADSYLPAGAFVKIVLLNGIDANAGSKAKGNPYPVLARVMDLAIFPNYWKGDIKECFMIGEATGELSSERVHIRFNTLSCMSKKGELVESSITSYAVGEDGKIALAGRVTSKQGAILARSLLAGFIQGAAQAFNYSYNTVTTTATGNVMTVNPSQAAQAGVSQGISQAASELAKFYMELNREMAPVIEINGGRQCEAVFITRTTLGKTGGKKGAK